MSRRRPGGADDRARAQAEAARPLGIGYAVGSYTDALPFPDGSFDGVGLDHGFHGRARFRRGDARGLSARPAGRASSRSTSCTSSFTGRRWQWVKDQAGHTAGLMVSPVTFDRAGYTDRRSFRPESGRTGRFAVPRFPRTMSDYVNGVPRQGFASSASKNRNLRRRLRGIAESGAVGRARRADARGRGGAARLAPQLAARVRRAIDRRRRRPALPAAAGSREPPRSRGRGPSGGSRPTAEHSGSPASMNTVPGARSVATLARTASPPPLHQSRPHPIPRRARARPQRLDRPAVMHHLLVGHRDHQRLQQRVANQRHRRIVSAGRLGERPVASEQGAAAADQPKATTPRLAQARGSHRSAARLATNQGRRPSEWRSPRPHQPPQARLVEGGEHVRRGVHLGRSPRRTGDRGADVGRMRIDFADVERQHARRPDAGRSCRGGFRRG